MTFDPGCCFKNEPVNIELSALYVNDPWNRLQAKCHQYVVNNLKKTKLSSIWTRYATLV